MRTVISVIQTEDFKRAVRRLTQKGYEGFARAMEISRLERGTDKELAEWMASFFVFGEYGNVEHFTMGLQPVKGDWIMPSAIDAQTNEARMVLKELEVLLLGFEVVGRTWARGTLILAVQAYISDEAMAKADMYQQPPVAVLKVNLTSTDQ